MSVFRFFVAFLVLFFNILNINAQYSVTFYALTASGSGGDSFLGHIWVGFKEPDKDEMRLGFYPEGLQAENGSSDISYTFSISMERYNLGKEIIGVYQDNSYIIGVNDCRYFVKKIAQTIGLNTPDTGIKSPSDWLAELVDMN